MAEGYGLHPDYTLDDLKEVIRSTRHDLTDLTVTIEDPISEDDRIAYRWTMRGRYQGDHGGRSHVGRVVTYTGITMLRLHEGKVIEDRYESSSPSLEQAAGFGGLAEGQVLPVDEIVLVRGSNERFAPIRTRTLAAADAGGLVVNVTLTATSNRRNRTLDWRGALRQYR